MPLVKNLAFTPSKLAGKPESVQLPYRLVWGQATSELRSPHAIWSSRELDCLAKDAGTLAKNIRSKPKTRLESSQPTHEATILLITSSLARKTSQLTDKYTSYFEFRSSCASRLSDNLAPKPSRLTPKARTGRVRRKKNMQY